MTPSDEMPHVQRHVTPSSPLRLLPPPPTGSHLSVAAGVVRVVVRLVNVVLPLCRVLCTIPLKVPRCPTIPSRLVAGGNTGLTTILLALRIKNDFTPHRRSTHRFKSIHCPSLRPHYYNVAAKSSMCNRQVCG